MQKDFLGKGWKYPVYVDHQHEIAMSEYDNDIKEAIWIILGTARGERVMRPDFGCGIHDMVFASLNSATLTLMENSVQEALLSWEPRIDLIGIQVSDEYAQEGKVVISIDYRVRSTNKRDNLVYPFYLKEGS